MVPEILWGKKFMYHVAYSLAHANSVEQENWINAVQGQVCPRPDPLRRSRKRI